VLDLVKKTKTPTTK